MLCSRFQSIVWMSVWSVGSAVLCNPVDAGETAFVGVNVVLVDAGEVLEDQTVVVEDGRIAAAGPRTSTPPPAEATRIDGTGQYLIPGLADMHIHLVNQEFMSAFLQKDDPVQPIEDMLYLYLANGVTTVRVMAGFPELLALREAIERGDVLGPRLIVTTPMFDGKKPIWPAPLGRPIPTPDAAVRAVREAKEDGYDMIKVYTLLGRDAYDAVIAEAKKVNLKVVGHVPIAVGLEQALASGQDEITHVEEFWRFTRNYGDEVVAQFTDAAKKAGVWFSPTLTTYRDQMTDAETVMNRPENRYLDPLLLDFWASRTVGANISEEAKAARAKIAETLADFMERLVNSMYDAGVPLMIGTDALNPMAVPGFSVHRELAEFVNAGIPNHEALRAATARPAEFMQESAEWGSIATGRRADLVLLSANPLDDIANTEKIEGVMVRGRWLSGKTIQQRLDQLRK